MTRPGSKKELFTLTIAPVESKAKLCGAMISESSPTDQSLTSSSARKPSLKPWLTNSGYSSLWKAKSKERQFAPAGTTRSRRRMEGSNAPRPSVPLPTPAPELSFGPGARAASPEVRSAELPPLGGRTVVVGPAAALAWVALHIAQRSETTRPPWSSDEATAGQGSRVTVAVAVPPPESVTVYVKESEAAKFAVCE